jgi:ABC-2 type transport system ATP-binding protein
MADRIGVIHRGEIIVVDDKAALMQRLGRKQLTLELQAPLAELPEALAERGLALAAGGRELVYTYDAQTEASGIAGLLAELEEAGIGFRDLRTTQSSLEDIFVDLVRER